MWKIVLATVVFVAAVAGAAYWLFGRDSGDDVGTFFTDLPTPASCESGALAVTASNAHFAAFTDGRVLAETGDKFLVADVSVRNGGSAPVSVAESGFYLAERPGEKRPVAALKEGAWPLSANLQSGATISGTLAFSVPLSVGAAKLVFDDGCNHQEWLVP